jgi:hypothetical protein
VRGEGDPSLTAERLRGHARVPSCARAPPRSSTPRDARGSPSTIMRLPRLPCAVARLLEQRPLPAPASPCASAWSCSTQQRLLVDVEAPHSVAPTSRRFVTSAGRRSKNGGRGCRGSPAPTVGARSTTRFYFYSSGDARKRGSSRGSPRRGPRGHPTLKSER